jgi:hypothetical protein
MGTSGLYSKKKALWHYAMSSANKNKWKEGYNNYRQGANTPDDNQPHSGSGSGKTYGTLQISTYQDNKESEISYTGSKTGDYDSFEDALEDVMVSGLGDIVVGGIGVTASIVAEAGSGGLATAVAYAGFVSSADKVGGGFNKLFNPKDYMGGTKDAQPIEFLVGKFLGEDGKEAYKTINLIGGVHSMANSSGKLVEIVGAYETIDAATEKLESLSK